MPSCAPILIHPSQFPQTWRKELLASFRHRSINHKFHYDSVKQAQKWIALHQAFSPANIDTSCRAMYRQALASVAARWGRRKAHVISLGCGSGAKDAMLLHALRINRNWVTYTPCDASAPLVVTAWARMHKELSASREIEGVVCDLAMAKDLDAVFRQQAPPGTSRLVLFFGMIPNFEPDAILPRLAKLVRKSDWLLMSANLAPGSDYEKGMRHVLPSYDNALTRDWLQTLLWDVGVERDDGDAEFSIEKKSGLWRIVCHYRFRRSRKLWIGPEVFHFARGETIRLFYSYRYTQDVLERVVKKHGLSVVDAWLAPSGEEGVFLCRRAASGSPQ